MSDQNFNNEWAIGTVVAAKSHPYDSEKDKKLVFISGDPQLLSPLMVITETIKENTKITYDENTGEQITNGEAYQCKCIWFSQKSYQIEEAIISSKLLKKIEINKDVISLGLKTIGSSVTLKTAYIEMGKIKSSMKETGRPGDNTKKILTSHLSFICPVLQVIGTVKSESKEPLYDIKTGTIKRRISQLLIKCKYYHPNSDKYSEVLIPMEALTKIPEADNVKLELIKDAVEQNLYLLLKTPDNDKISDTIIKPNVITFRNGEYYLDAYDYIADKQREFNLSNSKEEFSESLLFSTILPRFEEDADQALTLRLPVEHEIITLDKNKYWRIVYKDGKDVVTQRTISKMSVIPVNEIDDTGVIVPINYLKAQCELRKDIRYFRLDRIQKIMILIL